jgi:hypothetical protein
VRPAVRPYVWNRVDSIRQAVRQVNKKKSTVSAK